MGEFETRKPTRLKDFDYNKTGVYFLTICTKERCQVLSRIVGGDVLDAPNIELKIHGIVADRIINQMNYHYDDIVVDKYVIMPDHIHIILVVNKNGASGTSPPTVKQHSRVSQFVSTFKRFCNKEYGGNIWQTSFYDHIIRNRDDYNEHVKYISDNPMRWFYNKECDAR